MADRWLSLPLREYDTPNGTAVDPAYVHEYALAGEVAFYDGDRYVVRVYGEESTLDALTARDGVSELKRNEVVHFVKQYIEGTDIDSMEEVRAVFSIA